MNQPGGGRCRNSHLIIRDKDALNYPQEPPTRFYQFLKKFLLHSGNRFSGLIKGASAMDTSHHLTLNLNCFITQCQMLCKVIIIFFLFTEIVDGLSM